jgi:hypothetical protein
MNPRPKVHDLMIVFDAITTGQGGVAALKEAIPDIINFVALADCFERIGVLAYRNYSSNNVIQWSGWCSPFSTTGCVSQDDILNFVQALELPEDSKDNSHGASKAALAKAYQEMRPDANATIILLYTCAPPMFDQTSGHYNLEQMSLKDGYGGTGYLFRDWVTGAHTLAGNLLSIKRAVVLSFGFGSRDYNSDWSPYLFLSTMTGGDFYLTTKIGRVISRLTIGLLLIWIRADGSIDIPESFKIAYKHGTALTQKLQTVSEANIEGLCGEHSTSFYWVNNLNQTSTLDEGRSCLRARYDGVSTDTGHFISSGSSSIYTSSNLAINYIDGDEGYKRSVLKQLDRIIDTKMSVIAIHPLYGPLWRAVCSDQTDNNNNMKKSLLKKFGAHLNLITDVRDKKQTQAWLEESYNVFHEINDAILTIPSEHQFPLIYADPGSIYLQPNQDDAALTRAQLLDIGRSCDKDILRRLGNVLIRMHYVEQERKMPAKIKNTWPCLTPRIPLKLASTEYGHKF